MGAQQSATTVRRPAPCGRTRRCRRKPLTALRPRHEDREHVEHALGLVTAVAARPPASSRSTKRRIGSRNISSPPQTTNVGGNPERSAFATR